MAARKESPKFAQALLTGAGVAAVAILLQLSGALHLLELKTRDYRMNWTLPPKPAEGTPDHPEIAIMMITDESLKWAEKVTGKGWPWPRDMFGFMFRAAGMGKAKGILFDLLTHVDKENGAPTEAEWASDIQKAPPSWLAAPFYEDSQESADIRADLDKLLEKYALSLDSDGSVELPELYKSVRLPRSPMAEVVTGVSDVSSPRDVDGILRDYRLITRFRGRYYPSFVLAALMVREKVKIVEIRNRVLTVGSISVPLEKGAMLRLKFYPRFQFLPASAVIAGLWSIEDDKKETSFHPKNVENRFVMIGTDAAALFDLKVTPVTKVMPGTEIHATALRNILQKEYMQDLPAGIALILLVAVTLATALITRLTSAALGGGLSAALLLGYGGLSVLLFSSHWIVPLAVPMVAIGLAYAATSAVNFLHEGRQRLQTKRIFSQYVSAKVVDKILQHSDALHLEGERKPVTIFFMDFAGFTAMSEKLDPAELVKLISEYHNEAAEEIFKTEGTLDKFIGDAIMAYWNDPIGQPDHELRACLTAIGAQQRLLQMAKVMKERGLPEMTARIGLNSGVVTVGNMGAKHQVSYTLIGDEVNLASRLEGVNKEFGTKVIVSEATYLPVKDKLDVRELALIKVKGKKLPVRIFELIALKGEAPPERMEVVRKFEAALLDFRARKFTRAWEVFLSLSQKGDRASEVYVGLCERYMSEPPHADWDGSYQMEHK